MIFVTGSSSNIGVYFASMLSQQAIPFHVGTRTLKPENHSGAAEHVLFDFLKPSTFESAVRGCSAIFLMRLPPISNMQPTLNAFIDVARASGVGTQFCFSSGCQLQSVGTPSFGRTAFAHKRGLRLAQVAVQTALHVGIRFGQARTVTTTL